MTDWAELYWANVAAVSALAENLTDEQLAAGVPATPAWTVQELLGHVAGVAHDFATERLDGAPGEEWTERHVGERRAHAVGELIAELARHQESVAASVADNPRPAIVWNIAVHHADLNEALGLARVPERFWLPVVEALRARVPATPPEAGGLGSVDDYELFRALFSRRSRAQLRSWGTGLDDEALDALPIFGPREDDQPVPTAE